MKLLKLFSLSLAIISFLSISVFSVAQAQETNTEELANILVEFEVDEIDAQSLGIEEPDVLPGEFKYNWQIFKENAGLFFTFDKEKKVEKLEEISNRRLLEAKKLAEIGTNNAAKRVADALKRYETTRQQITTRLETNPELKKKLLEKFDSSQLKHQQVLSTVTEKLRNKLPENELNKLEDLKKTNALRWYEANKDDIQARLEKAIDNNSVGSKFKQLSNIATLQELGEILPEEAKEKIEAAAIRAEEKLAEKLANTTSADREKLEKYINNIKTSEVVKQKFISNLKDSDKLPPAVKEKARNIFDKYSNTLRNKFENLDTDEQKIFLNQFENGSRSHPANIQFLETLDSPENKERIRSLLESQVEGVKAKIQRTTDPAKLRSLEQNLQNYPVLRRQIQERQTEVQIAPLPRPSIDTTRPRPPAVNPQ